MPRLWAKRRGSHNISFNLKQYWMVTWYFLSEQCLNATHWWNTDDDADAHIWIPKFYEIIRHTHFPWYWMNKIYPMNKSTTMDPFMNELPTKDPSRTITRWSLYEQFQHTTIIFTYTVFGWWIYTELRLLRVYLLSAWSTSASASASLSSSSSSSSPLSSNKRPFFCWGLWEGLFDLEPEPKEVSATAPSDSSGVLGGEMARATRMRLSVIHWF